MRGTTNIVLVVSAIGVTALTACGGPVADGSPGKVVTPTGNSAVLAAWSGFPAHADPRPVVLLGQPVIGPATGFRNNADKVAFVSGNFMASTSLPETSATANGQPVMSATEAVRILSGPRHNVTLGAPVLVVTGARLAGAEFATDRGRQSLPAWVFTLGGVPDPVSVLALPDGAWWPKAGAPINQVVAVPASSQNTRQVTVWFVGGPAGTGPCSVEYSGSVVESANAVLVTPVPRPNADSNGVLCTDEGHRRSLTVTLASPLGGRVLLTPNAWTDQGK